MKKLLIVLSLVPIGSLNLTTVGCQYANLVKASLESRIRDYLNATSLLAEAAVLSQKTQNEKGQATGGEGLALKGASQYLYPQAFQKFFPNSRLGSASNNATPLTIREVLGSTFNFGNSDSAVYTVKSEANFQTNLELEYDLNQGKKPSDPTAQALALASGALTLFFGNNFNESLAPTLENFLGAGTNLIREKILENNGALIDQILAFVGLKDNATTENYTQLIFETFAESLKEDDLATTPEEWEALTFNVAFQKRQVNFWKGLAQILFSGLQDSPQQNGWTNYLKVFDQAQDPGDFAELVFKDPNSISIALNARLLNGVSELFRYLRTVFNYFQAVNERSIPFTAIKDYNHLFAVEPQNTNGVFINQILTETKYLNPDHVVKQDAQVQPEITQWMQKEDGSYRQILNLQSIFSFLQSFLSVDLKNDPHGFAFQRIISLFFSLPLKSGISDKNAWNKTALTPVFDLILQPILGQFLKNIPGVPAFLVKALLNNYLPTFRATLGDSAPAWDQAPGTIYSLLKALKSLGVLLKQIKNLPKFIEPSLTDLQELIMKEEAENISDPYQQTFGNPSWGIFGGDLLVKVLKVFQKNGLELNPDFLVVFKNIKTLLTTQLNPILKVFGLNIADLPIMFYGLKDFDFTAIVNTIAQEFEVRRNTPLSLQQKFLFNLNSLEKVLIAFIQPAQFEFQGAIPDLITQKKLLDSQQRTPTFLGLLITFGFSKELKEVLINNEKWTAQFAVSSSGFLLGNRRLKMRDPYFFASNSIFGQLAAMYGNNDLDEPKPLWTVNNQTISQFLVSLAKLNTWFSDYSLPLYTNNYFKPYFAPQNWQTTLFSSQNVDHLWANATIHYLLTYIHPQTKKQFHFEVFLERATTGGLEDWTVLGSWKIAKIEAKEN